MRDVSVDRRAAEEMVRRSGQMGVPVIADDREAIVGFDVRRLQQMAQRHRTPGLGLRVADWKDGAGAYVGSVRPGSPADRAGLKPGDVVEELSGRPVRNADDLERVARQRQSGQPTSVQVRRGQERHTFVIPS